MTDEPPSTAAAEQQPAPAPPQRKSVSAGHMVAGIFLILLSLCFILAGGGCTIALLVMFREVGADGIGLLLLSLATLGAGAALMWLGARFLSGKYD